MGLAFNLQGSGLWVNELSILKCSDRAIFDDEGRIPVGNRVANYPASIPRCRGIECGPLGSNSLRN